jgi:hypothetical protein
MVYLYLPSYWVNTPLKTSDNNGAKRFGQLALSPNCHFVNRLKIHYFEGNELRKGVRFGRQRPIN